MNMMLKLLIFINISFIGVESSGLIEVLQWNQIDYYNRGSAKAPTTPKYGDPDRVIFPESKWRGRREIITSRNQGISIAERAGFETSNDPYIPYNNVPMGVTHFNGRLFITIPRRRKGIPSTLNYIDLKAERGVRSPKLRPYPDFQTNALDTNNVSDQNRLVSVYRTTADSCRRLWFIDTGMLEYSNNFTQVKRPAIWIIDMTTNEVLRRFNIPESIVATGRGLASITVEVAENKCNAAFAYLPDLVNSQLFVYSYAKNRIWAFSHNYFNFDPLGGDLSIGGQNFRWNDGIFSTTLGRTNNRGFHDLYFHAMASTNEFVVSTEVLQNEQNSVRSDHGDDFRALGSRGESRQSTMHEFDKHTGVIFYDEIQRNGVGCWNTRTDFSASNHGTVQQDADRMIYPSDLTIDNDGTMWVMTNSMPIFIYSNLDPNNVNFRVWKQNTADAIKNTICE